MYHYDEREQQAWRARLARFKVQTQAYLAGSLGEDAYRACARPLGVRLHGGAPRVRIALPHGLLAPAQLRALAQAARRWDKGYVRFARGPSVQLNWARQRELPALLAALADAGLHGADDDGAIRIHCAAMPAGVPPFAPDDPLPWCELLRDWARRHARVQAPARRLTIAVVAAGANDIDNAPCDIALQLGGSAGLGVFRIRIGAALPVAIDGVDLLAYLDALLLTYADDTPVGHARPRRIARMVAALTPPGFTQRVEQHRHALAALAPVSDTAMPASCTAVSAHPLDAIAARFGWPSYADTRAAPPLSCTAQAGGRFVRWCARQLHAHALPGYAGVAIPARTPGMGPGEMSADQLDAIADLAQCYGGGALWLAPGPALILRAVPQQSLFPLWQQLALLTLANEDAD